MRMLVVLLLTFGSVSCADSIVQETPVAGVAPADFIARPLGSMKFEGAGAYIGSSESARAARLELLDRVMDRVGRIQSALRGHDSPQKRRETVWRELASAEMSAAERWFVEQMAATLILESLIGRPGVEPGAKQWDDAAAARSVELLMVHESPNAPLIADALVRLKGFWQDDRIASAASEASEHARQWLEDQCSECESEVKGAMPENTTARLDISGIRRGIHALTQLAEGK